MSALLTGRTAATATTRRDILETNVEVGPAQSRSGMDVGSSKLAVLYSGLSAWNAPCKSNRRYASWRATQSNFVVENAEELVTRRPISSAAPTFSGAWTRSSRLWQAQNKGNQISGIVPPFYMPQITVDTAGTFLLALADAAAPVALSSGTAGAQLFTRSAFLAALKLTADLTTFTNHDALIGTNAVTAFSPAAYKCAASCRTDGSAVINSSKSTYPITPGCTVGRPDDEYAFSPAGYDNVPPASDRASGQPFQGVMVK